MHIKTFINIFIALYCCTTPLIAQQFPKFTFTHINNHNQIPNEDCGYVYKDSKGFMWISTINGLCRYDGQNITVYKNEYNNPNAIANNNVGTVVEDKAGNIWLSHAKGVSCLNTNTGKFINYSSNEQDSSSLLGYINVIRVDKAGNIFNTASNGSVLNYFDERTKKFLRVDANLGADKKQIIGTLSEPQFDGSMYLQGRGGTFLFNAKTYRVTRVCDSSLYDPQSIFKDHTGKLWLGEWNGGLSIINETKKTKRNIIGGFNPNKINKYVFGNITEYKDVHGKYWILATEWSTGSIVILDPVTEKYQYQLLQIENEITSNMIPGIIYCDADGSVYVTSANGLLVSKPTRQAIENEYTYNRAKPADIYYDNMIRSGVQVPDGGYVFGLLEFNGLRYYDSNFVFKKAIKKYRYNGKIYDLDVKNFLQIESNKYLLSGKTGFAILKNAAITPVAYMSKKYRYTDTSFNMVRDMLPYGTDEFWVRIFNGGISIFNIKTGKFTKKYAYADKTKKIPLGSLFSIQNDRRGKLWINNANDIFVYDSFTDEFIKQPINQGKKLLSSIRNFCFDANNNIWVTGDGGLLRYNFNTKKEKLFANKFEEINYTTYKVVADKKNNIWIVHPAGISMLNTGLHTINNYSSKDGLPMNYCEYDPPFFMDQNDNLIAGNSGVVTRINTARLDEIKNNLPAISINQVEGIDSTLAIEINNKNEKIVILKAQNFPVNILFSIIDYSGSIERKYYYRYLGKDSAWIECKAGVVPITDNKPGIYTIEVTGTVGSQYPAKTDHIVFAILPRWYQTLLFKVAGILFSVLFLISLFRWRIKIAKKTESQQTEIQRLSAQQYKNELELSQISFYFSSSFKNLTTQEEVLWDVAKNLIGKLGFEDCMIYLWNDDETKLLQKAGYGPKGSIEEIDKLPFDVEPGQGVVGYVAQAKQSILIKDTRQDIRYRPDEMQRLSEICVPILYENNLLGVVDSEHSQEGFFTQHHLQLLINIAAHIANKLVELNNKNALERNKIELANTIENLKGAQLDALRSQMNPHFIFNSLNSIENFILKNEKLIASEYLGKFSKLIRNILDNSKSEKISLTKEIETLQLYIELERLRTDNSFDVIYQIPDNILDDNIVLPPMLMQPYAENAILHGLRRLENEKGRLTISINITNDECLEYVLEDNGIGRKKSIEQKSHNNFTHKSYGIDITQNRIDLYNQKNNISITYKTIDMYDAGYKSVGTKVIILIPLL